MKDPAERAPRWHWGVNKFESNQRCLLLPESCALSLSRVNRRLPFLPFPSIAPCSTYSPRYATITIFFFFYGLRRPLRNFRSTANFYCYINYISVARLFMGIATTYVQIPPLSELAGVTGMSGGPAYFDAAAGQTSTYTSAWPQPPPGTDPWGLPPDPQNYAGGGMPPAIAVYPAGPVSLMAPMSVPAYPPPGTPAHFDARNYIPPESSTAPFDARNYVPPDAQQPATMYSSYEPRTSESAFDTAMQLHGGGVISPVVPPAAYLSSPYHSSSSGGSSSYPQSPSGTLSRSMSSHPTEREARLYDRPGTWRPRFQMPRSGVGSLLPNLTRGKSFPPGASIIPTKFFFVFLFLFLFLFFFFLDPFLILC